MVSDILSSASVTIKSLSLTAACKEDVLFGTLLDMHQIRDNNVMST